MDFLMLEKNHIKVLNIFKFKYIYIYISLGVGAADGFSAATAHGYTVHFLTLLH